MAIIDVRSVGRRKQLMDDFSVPLPPSDGDGGRLLRDIIEQIVRSEVAAFEERQRSGQFLTALTSKEIHDAAARGKVVSGGTDIEPQQVDVEHAVANALQSFCDGIYLVVIDGDQVEDLDAEVRVRDDSRITFLRLTLLAGG